MLYSSNRDETTAVTDAVVTEERLPHSSMPCVDILKRVLHILDLVDFDPDTDVLVRSCTKATGFNGRTYVMFIALEDSKFLILLQRRTREGGNELFGRSCVIA